MKRKIILMFLLFYVSNVFVYTYAQEKTDSFYYAYNEKIKLTPAKSKLILRYSAIKGKATAKIQSFSKNIVHRSVDARTVIVTIIDEVEKNNLVDKLKNDSNLYSCQPIYTINTGLELGVTDEILVKFLDNVPQTQIEAINNLYKVTVIKKTEIYHLLKVPRGANALEIANKYFESGLVKFSHPNFISEAKVNYIPNDPYFAFQVALHNTGQLFNDNHTGTSGADIKAPEAWDITKGNSNIVVAVIDQGVTSNHPDLPNSRQVRLNGSNFGTGDANDPSPVGNDNHGNSCAGVIAATQDNNEGITGIAPYCKIMPIRWDGSTSVQGMCDAIKFAADNGADIISNSWGYDSDNPNSYPVIVEGIQYAVTNGRSGKGCVVLFAAGNTASHINGNNGTIQFPANVNISGVITVGASDRYDQQAQYSPSSNRNSSNNQVIDIVAPSHRAYPCQITGETFEMWSLDIPGDAGYNSWHNNGVCSNAPAVGELLLNAGTNFMSYTGRFGGTSHSCPVIAGVAALVLSVNPNLSQQNVFDILTSSTDKVGGYTYTNGQSNETGYGRVNAYKAVNAALPTISGPSQICSQGTYTIDLPGATVAWSSDVPMIFKVLSGNGTTTATFYIDFRRFLPTKAKVIAQVTMGNQTFTVTKDVQLGTPTPDYYIFQMTDDGVLSAVNAGVTGVEYFFQIANVPLSPKDNNYHWTIIPPPNIQGVDPQFNTIGTGQEINYMGRIPGAYTILLVYDDSECGSSLESIRTFNLSGEIINQTLTLYPNPATDMLNVSLTGQNEKSASVSSRATSVDVEPYTIELWNERSGLAKTISGNKSNIQISLRSLPKGMYYLHLKKKGKDVQKKPFWVQ